MKSKQYRPYRQSSISAFESCPMAYKLQAIDGCDGGNVYTREGARLHKIFEVMLLLGENPNATSGEWAAFERILPDVRGGMPEMILYLDENGKGCTKESAILQGQIDVTMKSGVAAFDYKMGARGYDDSFSDAKYERQADMYSCLLWGNGYMAKSGLFTFSFLFPIQQPDEKCAPRKSISYKIEEMPSLWERVKAELLAFEKDVIDAADMGWPMIETSCGSCLQYANCMVSRREIDMDDKILKMPAGELTAANVNQAVKLLFAIRALEKHASEAVEAYIKANGSVELDSGVYGYVTENRATVADKVGLIRALKDGGIPLAIIKDEMGLTVTAAKKLAGKGIYIAPYMGSTTVEKLVFRKKKKDVA